MKRKCALERRRLHCARELYAATPQRTDRCLFMIGIVGAPIVRCSGHIMSEHERVDNKNHHKLQHQQSSTRCVEQHGTHRLHLRFNLIIINVYLDKEITIIWTQSKYYRLVGAQESIACARTHTHTRDKFSQSEAGKKQNRNKWQQNNCS